MRGGLIFFGVLIVVAIAAIVGLLLRPATVIGVTDKSLAYSVRGAADSDVTGRCQEIDTSRVKDVTDGDDFICFALTGASGAVTSRYLVEVDDFGCWEGSRRESDEGPPKLDGCITITDLVRLGD